jgi:trehalose-phosphatase
MEHILTSWRRVSPEFCGKDILLFLDFDGTLTPIVSDPEKAKISLSGRRILKNIAGLNGVKTTIVSGRGLEDLKKRIAVPEVVLVGNHGIEIEGPSIRHVSPEAITLRKFFEKMASELKKRLDNIQGIHIENKVFGLSVHHRNVAPKDLPEAMNVFFNAINPSIRRSEVVYAEGKKVWEVRPAVPWDKGKIMMWLFARECARTGRPVLPVYVGDDLTDEDALKVLKSKAKGIGIKVTGDHKEESHADYWLHSPEEVFEFIKKLCTLKKSGRNERPAFNDGPPSGLV